jgi:hypothetical protein
MLWCGEPHMAHHTSDAAPSDATLGHSSSDPHWQLARRAHRERAGRARAAARAGDRDAAEVGEMKHLTEDEIDDYTRLRTPPEALATRVQAHVAVCPVCREALREALEFVEVLRKCWALN